MHIGSNIGFIVKMPCIAFLAECATINVEFIKKLGEIHRSRGEFYAPKSVNRSFAARLWAANKDSAPENFTRYIQTHCKSRVILYGKLRVPLFQGGV